MTRFAFQCFWLLVSDWLSIFRIFLPIRSSFWFCNQSSQLIKNSTQCEHLNNSLGNVSILQLHCRMIISISGAICLDLQFQSLFTNRDLRGPLPLITNRGHSVFTDRDLRGPLPLIRKHGHSLFTVACANAVYVMFCIFTYTKILVLRRKYVSSMEKCRCYIHALIVDSISLHCSDALNMRALSNELMVL
jgi:hypothetical protein